MVEVKIGGLVPDTKSPGSHILLLKIPNTPKLLPIWIGPAEANAILMVLRNQSFERPLTHDLMHHIIHGLGATVVRVVITSMQENTYFARVFLERGDEMISIDARPSDSVALAVRARCPIMITDEVLQSQADHLVEIEEKSGGSSLAPSPPEPEGNASTSEALEDLMRSVERGDSFDTDGEADDEDEGED